jgi:amino acid adenylation domain-containing protein
LDALEPVCDDLAVGASAKLTTQQLSLLAARRLTADPGSYNVALAFDLAGDVDRDRLESAIGQVFFEHPALRVSIEERAEGRWQVVGPVPQTLIDVVDQTPAEDVDEVVARVIQTGFDDEAQQRMRAHLIPTGHQAATLVLVFDHISVDAASIPVVLECLTQAYRDSGSSTAPVQLGYLSYAESQAALREQPGTVADTGFWESMTKDLSGIAVPATSLGRRASRKAVGAEVCSVPVQVPEDLVASAAKLGLTPFAVFHAAFHVALQHLTHSQRVAVGFPSIDWRRGAYPGVVGVFSDMLVLPSPANSGRLSSFAQELQGTVMEAMAHAGSGVDAARQRILAASGGRPGSIPMISFDDRPSAPPVLQGVEVRRRALTTSGSGKADILLSINSVDGRPQARLDFRTDVLDESLADSLAGAVENVLLELLEDSPASARTVGLVRGETLSRVRDWSVGASPFDYTSVAKKFAAQVERTPNDVALVESHRSMTYRELGSWVDRIARTLGEHGARQGDVVALCMPRSGAVVAATLALMSGGQVLFPIDVEQAPTFMSARLEDVGATLVLVAHDTPLPAAVAARVPVLCVPDPDLVNAADQASDTKSGSVGVGPDLEADAPAYLITTSGSSGRPKTVVISHGAIAQHIAFKATEFGFGADDRFLFKTVHTFDASLWEFLTPLTIGASVAIAPAQAHRDPGRLLEALKDFSVTVVQFVPTMLQALLVERRQWDCPTLRWVFAGGELLTQATVDATLKAAAVDVVNLYGPTETTIDATFHRCGPGPADRAAVPIGRPLRGVETYVLGWGGQLLPPGFPGELVVAGVGVGSGYLGRPMETETAFLDMAIGQVGTRRVYRTGDLASWGPTGLIDFHGREDGQVKVRGVRIDVDDIRHVLTSAPSVRDAVVTVHPRRTDALVAYIVSTDYDEAEVRGVLERRLPSTSWPAYLVHVNELPTTPSGKVDLRALPVPRTPRADRTSAAPRSAMESVLRTAVADALGTTADHVRPDATFFELGATSMSIIDIHRRVRDMIPVPIEVMDFFAHPTVDQLASELRRRRP